MARPEKESKTLLGARLRNIRRQTGDLERAEFADLLGISKSTIASYERGEAEPPASVLAIYHSRLGVNVTWAVTGEGEMFDDPSKAPAPTVAVDPELMERLYKVVDRAYRDLGRKQPAHLIANDAAGLFNTLLSKITDVRDTQLVDAVIPVIVREFKEKINRADSVPVPGKRSA